MRAAGGRPDGGRRRRRGLAIAAGALVVGLVALSVWRARNANGSLLGHEASLALLPPEYFQPDTRTGATIADLMDHITNGLVRIEGLQLKIVSYLSAANLRQGGMNSLPEIGKQLGVEHLIALDPRGPDDAPRVEIRLIEVPTQKVAWAASYMLDTTRFAEIEEDVVSRVSHSFLGRQSREPSLVPARRGGESARLAYLAGQRALRRRTPEGRIAPAQMLGALTVLVANPRADHDAVGTGHDRVAEVGDAVDVDERRRRREPQFHERDEALASGQHLPVVAVLVEMRDGIVERRGRQVLEAGWVHEVPSLRRAHPASAGRADRR